MIICVGLWDVDVMINGEYFDTIICAGPYLDTKTACRLMQIEYRADLDIEFRKTYR
jgi:hypothetical protein